MLVEVLNVLPLLSELLLDSQEPVYLSVWRFPLFEVSAGIGAGGSLRNGKIVMNVLGLLFLADVELLGGGLTLGESITECLVSFLVPC